MNWHERIIAAHTAVTNAVSHAAKMKSSRYFVWQEDGAADLLAEGKHVERVFTGTTDLFTKTEFDPWARAVEAAFDRHDIAWSLSYVGYEDDTGFYHHEWAWEVNDG